METQPRELQNYETEDGRIPFEEWLSSLRDKKAINRIQVRLDRIEEGNLGDFRSVGGGVFEFRIDYGPGYRLYFGQVGSIVVLLLCGGDKSTQDRDIRQAQKYWRDYEKRQITNK